MSTTKVVGDAESPDYRNVTVKVTASITLGDRWGINDFIADLVEDGCTAEEVDECVREFLLEDGSLFDVFDSDELVVTIEYDPPLAKVVV